MRKNGRTGEESSVKRRARRGREASEERRTSRSGSGEDSFSAKDSATIDEQPTVRLDDRVQFRVSPTEKWLLQFLAERAGTSVGRYVMDAVRSEGRPPVDRALAALEERAVREEALRRKRTRRPKHEPTAGDVVGQFRCPFLRREDARGFERVVARSAEKMGISELSAARFISFLLEEIAREVASGRVVRLPAFGIFGPWYSPEAKGVEGCLPRFVASTPFRDYVQWECHPRGNRNRELQAQRRRRRQRPSSVIDAMRTLRRHIGSQNREAQAAFERWIEMGL